MTNSQPSPISSALVPPRGAIVVGGSSGIGAAVARRLAREGWLVAVLGRRADMLEQVCSQINGLAGQQRAWAYAHDVTDYAQVPALFQTILRDMGRVDLVVYSAGVMLKMGLSEFDFDKDQTIINTNLLGAVAWFNQAAQVFERLGAGQIVGISSIAGERGRVGNPAYCASKAGFNTHLESLRNRLTRKGVNVLTVRPGFVETDMLAAGNGKYFWVISPDQAADDIYKAIRARKQGIFTPARWRLVALVLRHIPSFVFRRMKF